MKMHGSARRFQQACVACLVLASLAAGTIEARATDATPPRESGIYSWLRDLFELYRNEQSPTLQSLAVVGRYQGQYASVEADQGSADEWENRRIFLGLEAQLYHQLTLHAQIKLSEDLDPFYDEMYQFFAAWRPKDGPALIVGRLDFLYYGLERSTSSTKIVTIERGLLANQTQPGEVVGAVLENQHGGIGYRAAILSGTIDDEFSDFSGGIGIVADARRELPLFYEQGELHLDYLYNDGNGANNALRPYDHQLSLWHKGQAGPLEVGADVSYSHGLDEGPAVYGLTLLPVRTFATGVLRPHDALQAVLRYQIAFSDEDNGLAPQSRYERRVVPSGSGDRYQALYAGINYRFDADHLKLMGGVERSSMHDSAADGGAFDGWTYFGAVRVYF